MIGLLVDVSLSPTWVDVFARHGWSAVHWSTVGDPKAVDRTVMTWARENGYVVFTHDLDFGTVLALTRAAGPSVIQVRAHDVLPAHLELVVVSTLRRHEPQLLEGAIVTIDESRGKVRMLANRRRQMKMFDQQNTQGWLRRFAQRGSPCFCANSFEELISRNPGTGLHFLVTLANCLHS